MSIDQRFWSKVLIDDGCWLWTAGLKNGYGYFWNGNRMVFAHRHAYEYLVGPIPEGLELDHRHTCPKRCVRPGHMRPTTHKQNQENRAGARRGTRSGVRGVSWDAKVSRWVAYVSHQFVGGYDTIEEAKAAVIARRLEIFTHNDADRELAFANVD